MKKAFCCFSGGKDSCMALFKTLKEKKIQILYLLNMASEDGIHSRSHRISFDLLKLQSESIGIPLVQGKTSWQNYEDEFKRVVFELKKEGVDTGIFGDIDVEEHRNWVEKVCEEVGITPLLPLWKEEREKLLIEFIDVGFKAVVIAINSDFLGKEYLGREVNKEFIEELKNLDNIDLCGERGEYHTFVYDGPIFKNLIRFTFGDKILKDKRWFLQLNIVA